MGEAMCGFEKICDNILLYLVIGLVILYFLMTFAVKNGVLSAFNELNSQRC